MNIERPTSNFEWGKMKKQSLENLNYYMIFYRKHTN